MKVLIPAAGKGTRMLPLTAKKAKSLLPVAGKPVLDHVLDSLRGLDVSEYIFIIGHLGDQIREHIDKRVKEDLKRGVKFNVRFVDQNVLDGTAGSVRVAQEFIDEPLLIILGDNILSADFSVIKDCETEGIVWGHHVEDPRHLGVIVTDDDGFMQKIVEKPKEIISKLASIGTQYVRDYRALLDAINHLYAEGVDHDGEYYLPDAFQYMIDNGAKLKVARVVSWFDCGNPKATLATNREIVDGTILSDTSGANIIEPVCIGKNCTFSDCTIGPDVSIGDGCTIEGSTVSDSILDSGCIVKNSSVEKVIAGEGAIIETDKSDSLVV